MEFKPLVIGELTARIPVIQGGMGVGVSLHRLAGEVAAQGGIGVISTAQIGFLDKEFSKAPISTNLRVIGEEIQKAREIAHGGIIGVNIMVATSRYEEYVKAAVDAEVDLIISGAGLPMTLPKVVAGSNVKIAPIVSSVKSVEVITKYWIKKYNRLPDLIIIEGPKAGGHLGFSMEQLMEFEENNCYEKYEEEILQIIRFVRALEQEKEVRIPVVVAGGIYTREDAEHAFGLGADGVQMGTRFVTTYECDADMAYKQSYIHAGKEDIVLVKSPVGMPGRAIQNSFLQKVSQGNIPHGACYGCIKSCHPGDTPYCITEALVQAALGKLDQALLFCGSNAYRADKIEHVKDIMDEFKCEKKL